MRFDALDLRAYGPFEGRRLDLSAGNAGLHVVFGPNEAGKSSALRALVDALFGIPMRTTDNFVHPYPDLRVGATLRMRDGVALTFVRRKANRSPLWNAAEDQPLADDSLDRFLGGIDRDEFTRVFGLDHVRLREGARSLLEQQDGAAAAIVGSGLGIPDLREVQRELSDEAAELYSSRARKKPLNEVLRRIGAARKATIELSSTGVAWEAARQRLQLAETRLGAARAHETALRERLATLERLGRVREPVVARRIGAQRLAELEFVPDLDERFTVRRSGVEERLRQADARIESEQRSIAEVLERIAGLPDRYELLADEVAVLELRDRAAEVRKGLEDLTRLEARCEVARAECSAIAAALGVVISDATIAHLRMRRSGEPALRRLAPRCDQLTELLRRATDRSAALEAELAELGGPGDADREHPDVSALALAVQSARRLGEAENLLEVASGKHERTARRLAEHFARFSAGAGFDRDVDGLAAARVVGVEALDEFRTRFQQLDERARSAREDEERRAEELGAIDNDVRALHAGGAVPSQQDLDAVRGRRDALWGLVRRAWLDGAEVECAFGELTGNRDDRRTLPDEFERSVHGADDVGDSLRRESQRVSMLAEFDRRATALRAAIDGIRARRADVEAERAALAAAWHAAWNGSGLRVASPAAMRDVLADRELVLAVRAELAEQAAARDELAQRLATQRARLELALTAVGCGDGVDLSFAALLDKAERELEVRSGAAAARRRCAADRLAAERERAELESQLAAWRAEWRIAIEGLPVDERDAPDRVLDVVTSVGELLVHHDAASELEHRIAAIRRDAAELEHDATSLAGRWAPDLVGLGPRDVVRELTQRIGLEREQRTEREGLLRRRDELIDRRRQVEAEQQTARMQLEALCAEALVSDARQLPDVEARAAEKRRVRTEHASAEATLRREGARSLDDLEALVAAHAGLELGGELAPLTRDLAAALEAVEAGTRERIEAHHAWDAIDATPRAAAMAEEAQEALARARGMVARWARLTLASRLLQVGVERYRQANEAPVLRLASRHLGGLTRGRYGEIRTDVRDDGTPFLQVRTAERASRGEWRLVDQLSDGTRDQLHLALVLGSLEHRFGHEEPRPLVLDDVLVHFDDERSAAALDVLASFGSIAQVLMFTHHGRIREQAEALGARRGVFVHSLES